MALFKRCLPVLLALAATLSAGKARAQSTPAPRPAAKVQRQLVVTLTLPSAIGVVKDYAGILFSGDDNKTKKAALKRAPRTSNPVVRISVPLPGGWSSSKDDPPATPK